MTDELQSPPPRSGRVDLTADPMVLASAVLVGLGLVLLVLGVAGSWHWRAAVWGAVLASVAAFALVVVSAQRRGELLTREEADAAGAGPDQPVTRPARPRTPPPARPQAAPDDEPPPPRPRLAGFGKPKAPVPVAEVKPPPPQPSNVQVMHVQGSNVRVAPTPLPMPVNRPATAPAKPPSTPPATPPTIQVGAPRTPGFPTYQPVDPQAPVVQVRNRYHRPECRYVSVADDPVQTTVGAARASNAMPCGVCRP